MRPPNGFALLRRVSRPAHQQQEDPVSGYLLLFGSSFLAATILPFYSEVVLFAMLRDGGDAVPLVLTATAGNTLGAVVNWWLGRYLLNFQDRRWFYFKPAQIDKAQRWFQRYGVWTLLLAWMPVGGDPLTLIAGVMRVRLDVFVALVGLGKGLRYVTVVWLSDVTPF
ncbi:MAG: DedA family protein [Rhodocyclaceae bacterium]|nr:DedA family protein [Rhodocyclaceae bacterium]